MHLLYKNFKKLNQLQICSKYISNIVFLRYIFAFLQKKPARLGKFFYGIFQKFTLS